MGAAGAEDGKREAERHGQGERGAASHGDHSSSKVFLTRRARHDECRRHRNRSAIMRMAGRSGRVGRRAERPSAVRIFRDPRRFLTFARRTPCWRSTPTRVDGVRGASREVEEEDGGSDCRRRTPLKSAPRQTDHVGGKAERKGAGRPRCCISSFANSGPLPSSSCLK